VLNLPGERLAHYNQVLREQLAALTAELDRCLLPFRHIVGLGWGSSVTPATVDQHLSADITMLQAAVRELQGDLLAFRDPGKLGDILNHIELEQDIGSQGDPTSLMDFFTAPAPARRSKKRRRR
jgi:hypothetical protein